MRICFVSHSSVLGGAEKALLELIDFLRVNGKEILVVFPSEGTFVEEIEKRGIRYYISPYRWWMSKKRLPLYKRVIRVFIHVYVAIILSIKFLNFKCDLVYTNTITVCVGAIAAKFLGCPHIWHVHEFGYEDHRLLYDFGEKFSMWLVNSLSSAFIFNSEAVCKKYECHIPKNKLNVVYQAVEIKPQIPVRDFSIIEEHVDIKCLIVGALDKGKNQEEAIRAVGELVSEGLDARLYIVGDGDMGVKNSLELLVNRENLGDYVRFLGYIENPSFVFDCADVVLICSKSEAFGRVTVEAMKAGKPVIGANTGGTVELIRDGFNGFLYPSGDYRALAEKIMYLYRYPEVAKKIGENGRKWAKHVFTLDRYGNEVLEVLKHAVGRDKRKRV